MGFPKISPSVDIFGPGDCWIKGGGRFLCWWASVEKENKFGAELVEHLTAPLSSCCQARYQYLTQPFQMPRLARGLDK